MHTKHRSLGKRDVITCSVCPGETGPDRAVVLLMEMVGLCGFCRIREEIREGWGGRRNEGRCVRWGKRHWRLDPSKQPRKTPQPTTLVTINTHQNPIFLKIRP